MLTAIATLALAFQGGLPEVVPKDDLVIKESCRIKAGVYRIKDEGEPGVLRIEGENILVIMDGATLTGSAEGQTADTFTGTGIVITGKKNVIYGGSVRGFKVGVHVKGGEDHYLIDVNAGRNYAQRLKSTPAAEDESDWLRPHDNDEGEWAKNYGAGIWVEGGTRIRILGCVGHGSQNGILLDRTQNSVVRDCDFSFNSGWGIALWRSSDNEVAKNKFDWCVRGYSHGVYERGQDSAGILVFEQSHRNRFLRNSATHCGDGFFLFAGNETIERTGEGGCNDNVVERNDFSHAVANGIEATFSTGNRFALNRLDDCNYGIWAGYSRKSVFERNVIRNCTHAGIAIEHGSENVIRGNLIEGSRLGVSLWWDADEGFIESVYGKKNRTDSADTLVTGNAIGGGDAAFLIRDSARVRILGNWVLGAKEVVVTEGKCPELEEKPAEGEPEVGSKKWPKPAEKYRGRRFIILNEWGPYDFKSPMLFPAHQDAGSQARFFALGVNPPLKITRIKGLVKVALVNRGQTPGVLVTPKPSAGSYLPFEFAVESARGELVGSGTLLVADWNVRFWQWETDPREDPAAWKKLLESSPLASRRVSTLDFPWNSRGPGGPVKPDRFATVAETTLTLPAGEFELTTISDDGVRLWLDGDLVIDNWTHHASKEDRATRTLEEGAHTIRIEHFEIDGWARLGFGLAKKE